jgi:hypothetical protein
MMGRIEIVCFTSEKTRRNTRSDGTIKSLGAVIDGAGHHRAKMMCLRFLIIVQKVMSLITCLRYRDAFGSEDRGNIPKHNLVGEAMIAQAII